MAMKKKLILPFALAATFAIAFWGCDPAGEDEYCEQFDITAVAEQCEIPSVCCPDDGSDCYILAIDETKYMCDKTTASGTDTNGCSDATNAYIDAKCTTKVTAEQRAQIIREMNHFTAVLMARARENSICL